jgi:two-component system cell cycle response regulator DivK
MPGNLVLVVEDNEKNRRLLRKVLEVTGYRVVEVETGLAGVEAAREHKPDLILMDYQLPDIDGIEAFHRIRGDAAIPRVPIIAVTASAMPQDQKRMRDAGFDGFETKPISVTGLLATIARFLPPPAKDAA